MASVQASLPTVRIISTPAAVPPPPKGRNGRWGRVSVVAMYVLLACMAPALVCRGHAWRLPWSVVGMHGTCPGLLWAGMVVCCGHAWRLPWSVVGMHGICPGLLWVRWACMGARLPWFVGLDPTP